MSCLDSSGWKVGGADTFNWPETAAYVDLASLGRISFVAGCVGFFRESKATLATSNSACFFVGKVSGKVVNVSRPGILTSAHQWRLWPAPREWPWYSGTPAPMDCKYSCSKFLYLDISDESSPELKSDSRKGNLSNSGFKTFFFFFGDPGGIVTILTDYQRWY